MITSRQKGNPDAYAYVGRMRNVAWVAGYARHIQMEAGRVLGMEVQQVNNINLALPVTFGPEARLQSGFQETFPIKITAHVFGRRLENGERVAELRAIDAETPTLLDLPGMTVWEKVRPKGAPVDDFRPIGREDSPDSKGQNAVRLAGFVYGAAMAKDADGRDQKDCLIILLRQHEDPDKSIPVRVYGRYAATYMKKVQPGMPITILGEYRVRVKKIREAESDDGVDEVIRYPYIHASHARVADPKEILSVPPWALQQLDRLRELRSGRSRVAMGDEAENIATGGHPRVVGVTPEPADEEEVPAGAIEGPDFGGDLDA